MLVRAYCPERVRTLGSNSLLAMRLAARVHRTVHPDVQLRALLEAPTVAVMAAVILEHLADRNALRTSSVCWGRSKGCRAKRCNVAWQRTGQSILRPHGDGPRVGSLKNCAALRRLAIGRAEQCAEALEARQGYDGGPALIGGKQRWSSREDDSEP